MKGLKSIQGKSGQGEGRIVVRMGHVPSSYLARKKSGKDCFVFEQRDLK